MICGSGGSKSRLAKAAGAEPCGEMRDEQLHAAVAKHISKSKCAKHTMLDAVVVRSTCGSENGKSTTCSDHFWTFRCGFAWQAQGALHLPKSRQKGEGFMAVSKALAGWDI